MANIRSYISIYACLLTAFALCSCQSRPAGVWEGTKSQKKTANFWEGSDDDFLGFTDEDFFGPIGEDFVALEEDEIFTENVEKTAAQNPIAPGQTGSFLPHIDAFRTPSDQLANLFKTVHFNTDEHVLRDIDYVNVVNRISAYLKQHSGTYVVIAGHCDERAPQAYNLALGTRRANYVRNLMVQKGVKQEQLFTVSYGKERPLELGHNRLAWSKNRRVEFKIHEKDK